MKNRSSSGKPENQTPAGATAKADAPRIESASGPRVEMWPIDRPKPYEQNPRRNDAAVEKVAASIREFGWDSAIVVDRDGVIIAGHTRLKAAKRLGLAEVPVIVRADLTPEQAAALRLADNKTAELAEWDEPILAAELDALVGAVDMEPFGFMEDSTHHFGVKEIDPQTIFDAGVSLVIECDGNADAEEKFRKVTEELGWNAKLSTL